MDIKETSFWHFVDNVKIGGGRIHCQSEDLTSEINFALANESFKYFCVFVSTSSSFIAKVSHYSFLTLRRDKLFI